MAGARWPLPSPRAIFTFTLSVSPHLSPSSSVCPHARTQCPRTFAQVDLQTGYRTKSMLCVPVKYGGQTVAVAQLVNKMRDSAVVNFTPEDVKILELFASFAAVALRTLRMYYGAQREYHRSSRLLKLVENLSQVCDLFLQRAEGRVRLCAYDSVLFLILSSERVGPSDCR